MEGLTSEQAEQLANIFGREEFDFSVMAMPGEGEEEEDLENRDAAEIRAQRFALLRDIFPPEQLEKLYATEFDESVVAADVPERLFLRFYQRFVSFSH